MANVTVNKELVKTSGKSALLISCVGDGSGEETAALKVDISSLGIPRAKITRLQYSVSEGMAVQVLFDRVGADYLAAILVGNGTMNIDASGPILDPTPDVGATGDILFSTKGLVANKGYTITLEVDKVQ